MFSFIGHVFKSVSKSKYITIIRYTSWTLFNFKKEIFPLHLKTKLNIQEGNTCQYKQVVIYYKSRFVRFQDSDSRFYKI